MAAVPDVSLPLPFASSFEVFCLLALLRDLRDPSLAEAFGAVGVDGDAGEVDVSAAGAADGVALVSLVSFPVSALDTASALAASWRALL